MMANSWAEIKYRSTPELFSTCIQASFSNFSFQVSRVIQSMLYFQATGLQLHTKYNHHTARCLGHDFMRLGIQVVEIDHFHPIFWSFLPLIFKLTPKSLSLLG